MRKQVPTILAAAACVFGVVIATPLLAPTARADSLPNGYSVTCTQNGTQAICNISGCPRVSGQDAGDVVHVTANGGPENEITKSCNNTATTTINNVTGPVTVAVQGCRKQFGPIKDECGAWSDYNYTPPAPAAAPAPAANEKPTVCTGGPAAGQKFPAGYSCCPSGSAAPAVPAGQQCTAAAPVSCPAGSQSATVPAGQQCAAPANDVVMTISQNGLNANVAITNKSSLPAQCTYTATKTGGLVGPQTVNKSINVGANSTGAITDMLWPPLGTSYNAVTTCTVTYNGKQTSIGQSAQNVSG